MNVEISPTAGDGRIRRHFDARPTPMSDERLQVKWFVRYAYFGFIFSLPFEMAGFSLGGLLALSKFLGFIFLATAFLQRSICFRAPPRALWVFGSYLAILAVSALTVAYSYSDIDHEQLVVRYISRIQMLGLAWISYNVLREESVVKGTLLSLSVAIILLAVFQLAGLAGETQYSGDDRETAFDANPNTLAGIMAVGIIGMFGLAFGRKKSDWKDRLLFWSTSPLLATVLIRTGARGAVVALALSFSMLVLKKGNVATKFKMIFLGLLGITFLAIGSYQVPAVRERWEKTLMEGKVSGRDEIFLNAYELFLEKPIFGWGFQYHMLELGAKEGVPGRDPHNLYLWLLTEVGIIGALPFFAGLWICWWTAWKARFNIQGVTPLMMITYLLATGMKGTWHNSKLFWFIVAYTLASGTYRVARERWSRSSVAAVLSRRKMARVQASSRSPA